MRQTFLLWISNFHFINSNPFYGETKKKLIWFFSHDLITASFSFYFPCFSFEILRFNFPIALLKRTLSWCILLYPRCKLLVAICDPSDKSEREKNCEKSFYLLNFCWFLPFLSLFFFFSSSYLLENCFENPLIENFKKKNRMNLHKKND